MKYNMVLIPKVKQVSHEFIHLAKEASINRALQPDYLVRDLETGSIPHISVVQFQTRELTVVEIETLWGAAVQTWLDVLRAWDTNKCFSHFNESSDMSAALQSTIRLNAASKGEAPNAEDLASAGKIRHLHVPLRLMGYGKTPITDWFGTTPAIVAKMIEDACLHNQEASHQSSCCLM